MYQDPINTRDRAFFLRPSGGHLGQPINSAEPAGVVLGPLQDGSAGLRLYGIWSLQHPLPDSGVMRAGLEAMPDLKAPAFRADSIEGPSDKSGRLSQRVETRADPIADSAQQALNDAGKVLGSAEGLFAEDSAQRVLSQHKVARWPSWQRRSPMRSRPKPTRCSDAADQPAPALHQWITAGHTYAGAGDRAQ